MATGQSPPGYFFGSGGGHSALAGGTAHPAPTPSPLATGLLGADYVTVVEDRPTMSADIVFHYWPKLTQPTARYLCDS